MINELAKLTINIGIVLIVLGSILWLFSKVPFIGKLPGDIYYKKGNFSFYAPIATTLIIFLILSIILTIISNIKK